MELTSKLGLKEIQREAIKILYANLNDKIDELESSWEQDDYDLFLALDKGNITWTTERIKPENFYPGMVPSLLNNNDPDKYPNISVICYESSPFGSQDDTADSYFCRMNIEIMVKSQDELEVNTRCLNTLDAAHMVLLENKNLNKIVSYILGPKVSLGDVFSIRTDLRGTGERFVWQGGLLEYDVYKYVNLV